MKKYIISILAIFVLLSLALVAKGEMDATASKAAKLASVIRNNIRKIDTDHGTETIRTENWEDCGLEFTITPKKLENNHEIVVVENGEEYTLYVSTNGTCELNNSRGEEIASYDPDPSQHCKNVEVIKNFVDKVYKPVRRYFSKIAVGAE